MKIGTVFKWKEFEHNRIKGEIKPRWFICLGFSEIKMNVNGQLVVNNIMNVLCTTTTQIQHYMAGGSRVTHSKLIFESNSSPFEQRCILDFDSNLFYKSEVEINKKIGEGIIEIKGELSAEQLKLIYGKLRKSSIIAPIILNDVFKCYYDAGIKDIEKPKSNNS